MINRGLPECESPLTDRRIQRAQLASERETSAALRKRVAELEATLRALAGQENLEPWTRK
jgi:BMFP domain-containing protein YqiC